MQRHVHQAGEASGEHLWHPGDGLGVEHPAADHPERPEIALGDEDASVGQERHPPGMRQPLRHHGHPDLRDRMGVDDERLVRNGDAGEAGRLGLGLLLLGGGGGRRKEQDAGQREPGDDTTTRRRVAAHDGDLRVT